ncbi:MAG: hypothetical protein KC613_19280 [Myxococcales bacterium]|nr:hypothetical protein [Myxococcales bacterium]MCB9524610.1 hypothetical protein [Myxococcales bacterium]
MHTVWAGSLRAEVECVAISAEDDSISVPFRPGIDDVPELVVRLTAFNRSTDWWDHTRLIVLVPGAHGEPLGKRWDPALAQPTEDAAALSVFWVDAAQVGPREGVTLAFRVPLSLDTTKWRARLHPFPGRAVSLAVTLAAGELTEVAFQAATTVREVR